MARGHEYSWRRFAVTIPLTSIFARPAVVAHRGASFSEPENTRAAFEAAARAGAEMVEVDVRLTADGVPVVLHDADLARTTDRQGLVHTLTLAEVKRADASGGRGPRQEIPTLAETLDLLGSHGVGVDLEIKNLPGEPAYDPAEGILEATLSALSEAGFAPPAIITSFTMATIERARALAPSVHTGFLSIAAVDPRAALAYAREAGHALVLPQAPAVLEAGAGFVEEAHAVGVGVGTWTVDAETDLETLFGWGVDAVASNDPVLAVAVRDRVL